MWVLSLSFILIFTSVNVHSCCISCTQHEVCQGGLAAHEVGKVKINKGNAWVTHLQLVVCCCSESDTDNLGHWQLEWDRVNTKFSCHENEVYEGLPKWTWSDHNTCLARLSQPLTDVRTCNLPSMTQFSASVVSSKNWAHWHSWVMKTGRRRREQTITSILKKCHKSQCISGFP